MESSGGGAVLESARLAAEAPARKAAPYIFHGQTTSLCETCLEPVAAKIIIEDGKVFYLKRCLDHGVQKTLISDDLDYWRQQKLWIKPGDRPLRAQTRTEAGCPFDCGLCPDHEQHSCLAIVEVNQACNLACPVCFASAADIHGSHRPLAEIEAMLDALVASEGEPDLVQLSGGEPTIHPEFFAILDAVKARPIRHVMINTNGVRIAQDRAFVERLASYAPRLEVYLQFDSLDDDALMDLRGARLSRIRRQALEELERVGLSTTLVAVIKRGVNDREVAAIVRHALEWACVRGVTFQPVQDAGRNEGFDGDANRVVLTEIRREVARAGVFTLEDMIPLPCNPDQICIGYGLRQGRAVTPITSLLPREMVLQGPNTISYEAHPQLRGAILDLLSLATTQCNTGEKLAGVLCCLPQAMVPAELTYANSFRVVILQFLDRYNFDLATVKRSCVHFVTGDGQIIPFDTYNTFYREDAEGAGVVARHRALAAGRRA
ncbi:radical SAM protein [Novosphingobium album (ex Liu et al. 2023)]|uniref:Radical SAM protein n=1 Tax=Novosphingobium album (ex Liu et al. 2023) TaxID=3031130 RepID=A0ABT5WSM2_9SPHN|nr:radical SAM protein [Novosphingobium album (ex Liu et al. 2023)]MDE8653048.1 radical SAM protein [Novosphingobium album (ex Liu et al. 2023)]